MALDSVEVLIVGGGIAGLATALQLARAGQGGVVLLEREPAPGFYASGHNAGIARQLTGRPEHTELAIQGRALLAQAGLLAATGGCFPAAGAGGADALAAEARSFGLEATLAAGPPFPELAAVEHLRVAGDGVIAIPGLLDHCRAGALAAGASLRFGCGVREIQADRDGFRVRSDQGELRARVLVNAAGAWAGALGRMAGGLDLALKPMRRHLAWSSARYPQDRPYVWWADRPLYFRPEAGGVLLCACDEQEAPLPGPGRQPGTDSAVLESLAGSLRRLAPELAGAPVDRLWCGLRTFAGDRRFLLGPDPVNPRLFWVAGLGGHGMTTGLAVGAAAAAAILQGKTCPGLHLGRPFPH